MNSITYLLSLIQFLYQQNCWLITFICKYIPLKQWAFDDSHSPKYQKFRTDELPMLQFHQNDWDWQLLIPYFEYKYHKKIRPVARRKECDISPDCTCPSCHAPQPFLYRNNGSKGHLKCKVCDTNFSTDDNRFSKHYTLRCPHCGHALVHKKDRKHFILHKCVNQKCPYYLHNLKNVDKEHLEKDYGENEYKLHYLIANYCKSAAICIKPFVDNYDYGAGTTFTADETYIKVRGIKSYIWFIMDAAKRSIIGYRVSDNRGVGPCIMAMRMAFRHFKELPKNFRFIADGYSAYPLAAQQFFHEFGDAFKFHITQVIGLTNDDAVSKEFRPFKQMIERLNRTYKASYRKTNGFDTIDGANYDLALWVAYYNFLRPHKHNNYHVLNDVEILRGADNMPGKWQLLIFLGQQTILNLRKTAAV